MIIRKYKRSDFENVFKLYLALDDSEDKFDSNLVPSKKILEEDRKEVMKRLNKRSTICLIAENDGVMCGVIDGYIIESIYYKEKVSYLDHLYVIDKYRRKKVGQSLIEEFTKIAQQKNAKYLKLNAFENNIPAVNLYKKLGFEEYSIYYSKKI